eukprot:5252228-Prymnesium_polylepis.1
MARAATTARHNGVAQAPLTVAAATSTRPASPSPAPTAECGVAATGTAQHAFAGGAAEQSAAARFRPAGVATPAASANTLNAGAASR